jgi:GNAT superfamily N-acetyltransferase
LNSTVQWASGFGSLSRTRKQVSDSTTNGGTAAPSIPIPKSIFLRVLEKINEVARVELDNEVGIDHYADVPPLGATALEIQFIEVHDDHRGRGIGHAVIDLLHSRYPDRRLVAFSEGADGFWSSLGWRRHLHADPEEASFFRPLFIQPQA